MFTLEGKSVFKGICIGKILFYERGKNEVVKDKIEDVEQEVERFQLAKRKTIEQLKALYRKAIVEVGEDNAGIFEVHQMMLEDEEYSDSVINIIVTQQLNAEYAVKETSNHFASVFEAMEDPYMQGRAADVKDISQRLIAVLTNRDNQAMEMTDSVIIAADDLAPSETVQLDKEKVLGFATRYGSTNSHTAILARTMGIPAVIGLGEELVSNLNGKLAIIDGFTGKLYIDPDDETLRIMQSKQAENARQQELLQQLKGKEDVTIDGRKINLYANIGNGSDLGAVLHNDARGIGLFRSEFLYLESTDYPSEEYQFSQYKKVLEGMEGKKVIIRTLDIGADKQAGYFDLDKEENPALGYRAIRICLTREEVFKTQLRALFRASVYGKLAIMFPMIISMWEVKRIKEIVEKVKEELLREDKPFAENIELGIMIETPAAVMISDELAREVDFFSVGTNDLTQYTLAIDRQNPQLNIFYDAHHPALLKMIKMIVDNAHANGIWAGICGELGADMELTETFLAMGYDELSVSPAFILPLRKKIRETDMRQFSQKEGI
jgi:phosphotransferase system enzyme I (PtsI)